VFFDRLVFIIRPVKISGVGDAAAHPNAHGFDSLSTGRERIKIREASTGDDIAGRLL
jgi:hypothetical protein